MSDEIDTRYIVPDIIVEEAVIGESTQRPPTPDMVVNALNGEDTQAPEMVELYALDPNAPPQPEPIPTAPEGKVMWQVGENTFEVVTQEEADRRTMEIRIAAGGCPSAEPASLLQECYDCGHVLAAHVGGFFICTICLREGRPSPTI